MENKMKKIIVIVMVMSGLAGVVNAQLIPFSGTPNLNQALTFDKFDTLGGTRTLTSVEVKFTLNSHNGQLILDNDGALPAAGTFEFGSNGGISSTDVPLVNGIFQPVTANLAAVHSGPFNLAGDPAPISGDFNPAAPDGMQYNGGNESDSDSGFIAPSVFASYIGAGGTFDIDVAVIQWQDFGGVSGIEYAVTPVDVDGSVEVIYTYIPEPVTLSFMSIGGLALLKRRKK